MTSLGPARDPFFYYGGRPSLLGELLAGPAAAPFGGDSGMDELMDNLVSQALTSFGRMTLGPETALLEGATIPATRTRGARLLAPAAAAAVLGASAEGMQPRCDVWSDDAGFHVEAELPGFHKEDLNIELAGGRLQLQGFHRRTEQLPNRDFFLSERRQGRFTRSIPLPPSVDMQAAEGLRARMEEGVLRLDMPLHKEGREARRRIAVE